MSEHRIKVTNLSDGEIVRHSLLLIRGFVSPPTSSDHAHCAANKSDIHLSQGHNHLIEAVNAVNGEFKFIIELDLSIQPQSANSGSRHQVELSLRYCDSNIVIRCFYQSLTSLFRIQPIYVLCHDEEEAQTQIHCQKIDLNLRLAATLFAEKLKEASFERTTYQLHSGCKIFRCESLSLAKAWNSDEQTLWQHIAEELIERNQFDDGSDVKLKIVAFLACTKYEGSKVVASGDFSYRNIRQNLRGHVALGGGDLALFGSAFFYAWPHTVPQITDCLRNHRKVDPLTEPDESNYRKTYAGVYATTLGAVCHELGHIFDLGHTRDGIMGSGFDYLNRVLTVDVLTENLPKRIVKIESKPNTSSRLTKLKGNSNAFLNNYREQKTNDGFFFTRNCAVILAHHKWLRNELNNDLIHSRKANILFHNETRTIECDTHALKIVEIRSKIDSLVDAYYEFQTSSNEPLVFRFQLPRDKWRNLESHYLFAMTVDGQSKRLEFAYVEKNIESDRVDVICSETCLTD